MYKKKIVNVFNLQILYDIDDISFQYFTYGAVDIVACVVKGGMSFFPAVRFHSLIILLCLIFALSVMLKIEKNI